MGCGRGRGRLEEEEGMVELDERGETPIFRMI